MLLIRISSVCVDIGKKKNSSQKPPPLLRVVRIPQISGQVHVCLAGYTLGSWLDNGGAGGGGGTLKSSAVVHGLVGAHVLGPG